MKEKETFFFFFLTTKTKKQQRLSNSRCRQQTRRSHRRQDGETGTLEKRTDCVNLGSGANEGSCRFTGSKPRVLLQQRNLLPSLAMAAPAPLLTHRLRNSAGSSGWEHTAAALDSSSWRLRSAEASSPVKKVRRAFTDSSGKTKWPSCNHQQLLRKQMEANPPTLPFPNDLVPQRSRSPAVPFPNAPVPQRSRSR